jgi:preprotein translocase subunit SecD
VGFDPVTRRSSVLTALAAPGFVALTDSGTASLPPGRRVSLSCKRQGPDCPPGSQVGATNLGAKPYPVLQIVVPGTYVKPDSARVGFDSLGQPTVTYELTGKGSRRWCAFTSSHVGRYSAVVVDNAVISDPVIQGAICGGETEIAGMASAKRAKQLAIFLNYGAQPVALHAAGTQ